MSVCVCVTDKTDRHEDRQEGGSPVATEAAVLDPSEKLNTLKSTSHVADLAT